MSRPVFDYLVIYRKQLGDVLLLQPALEVLAGRGSVGLSTRPGFADLLALMPGPVHLAPETWPRAREVLCLEAKTAALLYAAQAFGARRRLILTRDEAPWWQALIFRDKQILPGGATYRGALFHAMAGGAPEDFRPPRLLPPPDDWQPPGLPAAYGLIHPTSAWQRKTWSPERWVEALQGLGSELPWVISSGPSPWEVELAGKLAAGLGQRAINLAGRTSLRQYLALLAGARIVFCVDGSASHLAAAFGKPVLTLFGPTNPAHWHWPTPTTPRLWAADFVAEKKPPVDAIPVAAVRQAAAALLELAHG